MTDQRAEIPIFPSTTEVVWQQPPETITNQCNLNKTNIDSTIYYTHKILKKTVARQTTPPKETQPQNYVVATEHLGNQTGNEPVPFLNCSKNCPTDTQKSQQHITTTLTEDTTIPPLTTRTPLIGEGLMTDEQTNEFYIPLTSTVVLKRKQETLYAPPDFVNNLTVDILVDSEAYVSAFAQNDLDTKKTEAPQNTLKSDDPAKFQIQVGKGQLEEPLATTTLKLENLDKILS